MITVKFVKGPLKGKVKSYTDPRALVCIEGMYEIYSDEVIPDATKEDTGPTQNKEKKQRGKNK